MYKDEIYVESDKVASKPDDTEDYDIQLDDINLREDDSDDELLKEMRERAAYGFTYWQNNYDRSQFDRKMVAGDQWPEEIRVEREEDGRPMLTINKLPSFVAQVAGDALQKKINCKLKPVEGSSGKEGENKIKNVAGSGDYTRAEILEGLIRNIEYTSNAEGHYDRQFKNTLEGAFGWLRVVTERNKFDPFVLDAKIIGLKNPLSALIDPDCKEPDYSDKKWGFVFNQMPKKQFDKVYPDASVGALDGSPVEQYWVGDDHVGVAEYFTLEHCQKTLFKMSNGEIWHEDQLGDDKEAFIKAGGTKELSIVDQVKMPTYGVFWRLCTAFDVLEGPKPFPTSMIPLFPMLGREVITGDEVIYESLIRHATDSQLEYNYWRTAATEMVALQPKAPYIGPAAAFEHHKEQWQNANRKNYAYLPYTETQSGARPERQPMHNQAIGEMSQSMQANDDMKATIGLFDASLGNRSNETSGIAIAERKSEGETATYEFVDNRDKCVQCVYKCLLELIPKIFDTQRQMRIFSKEGKEDWVNINEVIEVDGTEHIVNDLNYVRYDAVVETGPAYATQRQEAMSALLEFIRVVPEAGSAAMDLIADMADFPGSEEFYERLRRMVPIELLGEADRIVRLEEQQNLPQPPVPPELQTQQQIAEAEKAKEEAKVQQKQLDFQIQEQKTMQAMAEAQAVAGGDPSVIRDIVADALAEIAAMSANPVQAPPMQQDPSMMPQDPNALPQV
jgi:hypothetical protein